MDRKVNTIMAEVKKSADKTVVGKAIWKLMSVPSILFGRAVVPTCNTLIKGIQRRENRVWRYLMDIGSYSSVDALRGEIGASLVRSRVMETTLQYVRSVMSSKFENIKETGHSVSNHPMCLLTRFRFLRNFTEMFSYIENAQSQNITSISLQLFNW